MPGVVLHVLGESFDPRPFLATASLRPYRVFLRGDRRFPESTRGGKRGHSTFSGN